MKPKSITPAPHPAVRKASKPCLHSVPDPRPGWAWVRGSVRKTDRFMKADGWTVFCGNPDVSYVTDGPRIYHKEGADTFIVTGYIRRLTRQQKGRKK